MIDRRARILAMKPADRALLVDLMRRQRDEIPAKIAALQEDLRQYDEWLAEFAPADEGGAE